ncbi:MAG: ParA family protein, partial [Phycisphaerae bacterium]|nr:ParA family protein [Phycisphaerae bacterium]
NQKGGVGKTTTVANLGVALADAGYDVCLVDLDSQSHLTLHLGVEPADDAPTIYDVLTGESGVSAAAEMLKPNLCLLPSTSDMSSVEIELSKRDNWELSLRRGLEAARDLPHEFVLIDCPPALGLLTINALAAADEVLIPLQPHFLAMQGLARLLETIQQVRQHLNPKLRLGGVVLCMHESVTKLGRDVVDEVRDFLAAARGANVPWSEARLFETVIRRNIRLAECPSHGKAIFDYDPRSNGAMDYLALREEFLSLYPEIRKTAAEESQAGQYIAPPIPYPTASEVPASHDTPS